MVPIVSISNLVSALFFCGITFKVYSSYKRTRDKNVGSFLVFFLFLSSMFLLLSTPGLIFTDLKTIGLVFSLYPSLAFLGLIFLGLIPLNILRWNRMKKIFSGVMIVLALLITALNLINWGSAVSYSKEPFVYWEDTRGILVNTIIGAILGIGVFLVMIFFLLQALRASDKYVRIRAFLVIGGLIVLTAMVLINFVVGASAKEYVSSVATSLLGILAGFVLLAGVLYKYKPLA